MLGDAVRGQPEPVDRGVGEPIARRGGDVELVGLGQGHRSLAQQPGGAAEPVLFLAAGDDGQIGGGPFCPPGQVQAVFVKVAHNRKVSPTGREVNASSEFHQGQSVFQNGIVGGVSRRDFAAFLGPLGDGSASNNMLFQGGLRPYMA